MKRDDLVPLKRVLAAIGVSRTTLWRALRSDIEGLPPPIVVRRRMYWRPSDIACLEAALDRYGGRCVFEANRARRPAHDRATKDFGVGAVWLRTGERAKRPTGSAATPAQRDLFEG